MIVALVIVALGAVLALGAALRPSTRPPPRLDERLLAAEPETRWLMRSLLR